MLADSGVPIRGSLHLGQVGAAVDDVWGPLQLSDSVTFVLEDWDCLGLGGLCEFPSPCSVGFHILPPPPPTWFHFKRLRLPPHCSQLPECSWYLTFPGLPVSRIDINH